MQIADVREQMIEQQVRAWDVLDDSVRADDIETAIGGADLVFATTARRGFSGVIQPREAAARAVASFNTL